VQRRSTPDGEPQFTSVGALRTGTGCIQVKRCLLRKPSFPVLDQMDSNLLKHPHIATVVSMTGWNNPAITPFSSRIGLGENCCFQNYLA